MVYISKGISKSSLRKPLKVTRCGKTIQLAGLQAELWRKGQYGFAAIQTKAEELALENLSKVGLAEIQQKSISTTRYFALVCCVLCPTRWPGFGLSAGEKELLCWLKKAGLRMTVALQGYNFGNGYISWALARGGYSKENAREFSQMQAAAHGWSGYGDIYYVDHVLRYYQVSAGGMGDASAIADGRFAYPFPGHTWDTYPGHNGIDISFANCYGEPVYAVAAGTVRYTQDGWTPAHGVGGMWSFGNSVFIEHGDGWISAYGHLSALAVSSGENVTQGQLIGYIGSTGNSTGPHLHLALYHNGDAGIGGQNFAELAWPQYRD